MNFFEYIPRSGIVGHWVYNCSTLVGTAQKISKHFVTMYVPTSNVKTVPVAPCAY